MKLVSRGQEISIFMLRFLVPLGPAGGQIIRLVLLHVAHSEAAHTRALAANLL